MKLKFCPDCDSLLGKKEIEERIQLVCGCGYNQMVTDNGEGDGVISNPIVKELIKTYGPSKMIIPIKKKFVSENGDNSNFVKVSEIFDVQHASGYWKKYLKTDFLTFLSSKYSGINADNFVQIGSEEDRDFIERFMRVDGFFYNPTSGNVPKNQGAWFKTIMQYRYKPEKEYSEAFNSPEPHNPLYKWNPNYIKVTQKVCTRKQYEKILLKPVITWLYRDLKLNKKDRNWFLKLKVKFIQEFEITDEELEEMFLE